MDYEEIGFNIDMIIEQLCSDAKKIGWYLTTNDIWFDDSRAWSLYVSGMALNLPVNKFGAYRNYEGGGILGPMRSNGREEDGTLELAGLFETALKDIEAVINYGFEDAEEWELPTGVLL